MIIDSSSLKESVSLVQLQNHGHELMAMTCEEHVMRIIGSDDQLRVQAEAFFKPMREFVFWLEAEAPLRRLAGLRQFCLHRQQNGEFFPHNRLQHSRMVAANAIVAALMRDASQQEIATCFFGAMLHDLGHSAFSHQMDEFLMHRGFANHEERGQARVQNCQYLANIFRGAGVEAAEVVKVMQEKGVAGACQSIADTLAYVELDSALTGTRISPEFSFAVLSSVESVQKSGSWNTYHVSTAALLQELLNRRAELHHDVYGGNNGEFYVGAMEQVMSWLIHERLMQAVEVVEMQDAELDARLEILLQGNNVPAMVQSAYRILCGDKTEVANHWLVEYFTSHALAVKHLQDRRMYRTAKHIYVPAFYGDNKTLHVVVNGRDKLLRGVAAVDSERRTHRVFTFKHS